MNGILGLLQLLRCAGLETKHAQFVETAIGSGMGLLALIDDILDISRIEAGKVELVYEPFVLSGVLDSVVRLFELQARKKGVSLEAEVVAGVPQRLGGDPARLRQILFNLVGNAVKFTPSGTVRITVRPAKGPVLRDSPVRRRTDQGMVWLCFSVADTGVGIAPDVLPRIWDPFTQGDGSYTRAYQGTGLGLSIVRRLAGLMGGQVDVESQVGKGTTFNVTLGLGAEAPPVQASIPLEVPAVEAALTPNGGEEDALKECCAVQDPQRPLCILLAEDNPVNCIYVEELLGDMGHTVTTVQNGQQVLDALNRSPYDLIFMDVQMPVMDGLEATKRIRSTAWKLIDSKVPIVAMTAHAMKGDRELFLAAGMDDYMAKPFQREDLERILKRLLP